MLGLGLGLNKGTAGFDVRNYANLIAYYDARKSPYTLATGVSQWNDISGNGRHLTQATGASQPTYNAGSGFPYLQFDGTDDFMKTGSFTQSQPISVYFVGQQVTWTNTDIFWDGLAAGCQAFQNGSTPNIGINAGSTLGSVSSLAVGANGILCAVFNGASSSLRHNRNSAITGAAGAGNPDGFTLGSTRVPSAYGNIRVSAFAAFSVAHTTAEQDNIIAGLGAEWGIAA
jgi:hypothetical protein